MIHEILHALGFYHHFQRHDRDEYVRVNWDNINGGEKGGAASRNFHKKDQFKTDHFMSWDFLSIMNHGYTERDTIGKTKCQCQNSDMFCLIPPRSY